MKGFFYKFKSEKEKKERSLKENNESKKVSDLIYLIHLECNSFLRKNSFFCF